MESLLKSLTDEEWKRIYVRLTQFAYYRVALYHWKTAKDSLPLGYQIEDLVLNAIEKTLNGTSSTGRVKGMRKWNSKNCPDLLIFLMGVIRSDIDALAKRSEHQVTEYLHPVDPNGVTLIEPSDENEENQFDELLEALQVQFQSDSEVMKVIQATAQLIHEGITPTSTAVGEITGLKYSQILNAKRRIKRNLLQKNKAINNQKVSPIDEVKGIKKIRKVL